MTIRRVLALLLCLILMGLPLMSACMEEAESPQLPSASAEDGAIAPDEPEVVEEEAPDVLPEEAPEVELGDAPIVDVSAEDAPVEPEPVQPLPEGEGAQLPGEPAEEPEIVAPEPEEDAPALVVDEAMFEDAPALLAAAESEEISPLLSADAEVLELGKGEKRALNIRFADSVDRPLEFTSTDAKVAAVDATGTVTGKGVGSAEILAGSEIGALRVPVTVCNAPKKVGISAPRRTLGAGEEIALTAILPDGTASALYFSSGSKKIAEVDANGVVTTHRDGKVTISVKTFNKKKASVKLTVRKAPQSVSLGAHEITLGIGQSCAQSVALSKGSAGACTFESDAPEIASVDVATGVITAVSAGVAQVTVRTYNEKEDVCTVIVKPAPSCISLAEEKIVVGKGEKVQIPAITLGAPGEDCAAGLSYASSDGKYVTVTQAGVIKGVRAGSATVTATTHNGRSADLRVTVINAPKKVRLSVPRKTLGVGEQIALTAILPAGTSSALRFGSGNNRVATVDADGVVTALKEGKATISVKTFNNKKASVKLTVRKAPESVSLGAHEITLGVGQSCGQSATLSRGSAGACTFESESPGIVSVDAATGQLTGVAVGEARVTVRTYNEKADVCTVTVKRAPEHISLAQTEIVIGKGEKVQIPEIALSAEGGDCAAGLSYATSRKKYVTVTQAGLIKGVRAGSATVTVTTHNGLSADLLVTVKKAPSKVKLGVDHRTLGVGEKLPMKISLSSGSMSALRISSSNEAVARVESREDGYWVCAEQTGTATVTVKTFNNKKASLKFSVKPAPEGIALNLNQATLGQGEGLALSAALSEGSGGGYSFSSDDAGIAAVDARTGAVKAVGIGSTTIRVRSYNDCEAICALQVKSAPDGISLPEASLTLFAGDSYRLGTPILAGADPASFAIKYATSNKRYVKVNAQGVVTGVRAGSAKITATTFNKKKVTIKVSVKSAPKSISFAENSRTLFIGEGFAPEVKFAGNIVGSYSLSSSNGEAVAIAEDGRTLRALSAGAVEITATSFNRKQAKMTVVVPALPEKLELEPGAAELCVGETLALRATMPEGQGARVSYESSDAGKAAVSETGEIRAIGEGGATITARTSNGLEAQCAVTVYIAPTGIRLYREEVELEADAAIEMEIGDEPVQLRAATEPHGKGSVTFTSSDPKVASVDDAGLVSAVGFGACEIVAATYDGAHSISCTVHVKGLPLDGLRIGIDPGHQRKSNTSKEASSPAGGTMKYKVSSGTQGVSTRIPENVTNLAIGLKLRDALVAQGAEVYMTRETADVNISNQERAFKMNNLGVDLALRLHCNGATDKSAHGMDVYTRKTCAYGANVVDGKALMANEKRAAEAVFAELGAATGAKKRGIHYTDNYTMNNWSTVPCLLVEMGFMTNPEEDVKLNDPAYQDKIVKGLINAICVYAGREKLF